MMRLTAAAAYLAAFCARAGKPLPSVDSVLTKANSKAHDFAQQAIALQQKLQEQQEQSRAVLHSQKQEYELRLQAQSNLSHAIERMNVELLSGNDELKARSDTMMAYLKALSEKNAGLRSTLRQVTEKVSAAQLFLVDSLKVTDDSESKELEVLIPATPKPTLEHFLAVTSGKLSLLAVGTTRRSDTEDVIQGLSSSLTEIAIASKEGVAELKAHFLESFEKGQVHQSELNATQVALLQNQTSLKEYYAKLLEAKAHLEATNKALLERLRAVQTFANKVGSSAASSLRPEVLTTNETPTSNQASEVNETGILKVNSSSQANETRAATGFLKRVPTTVAVNRSISFLAELPKVASPIAKPDLRAVQSDPVDDLKQLLYSNAPSQEDLKQWFGSKVQNVSIADANNSISFLEELSKALEHPVSLISKPGLHAVQSDPLDDLKTLYSKAPSQEDLKTWFGPKTPSQEEVQDWLASKDDVKQWVANNLR